MRRITTIAVSLICPIVFSYFILIGEALATSGYVGPTGLAIGTLLAFVPSKSGLAVAADRRETIAGLHCDQRTKITSTSKRGMIAIAVTGNSRWYDMAALVGAKGRVVTNDELCRYAAIAPHLFDMQHTALAWLDLSNEPLTEANIVELKVHCTAEANRFANEHQSLLQDMTSALMNVVVMSFYPTSGMSTVRSFRVDYSPRTRAFAAGDVEVISYGPTDVGGWHLFGDADLFAQHVLPTLGSEKMSISARELLGQRMLVRDISIDQAKALASDLIEIATRNPGLPDVGGQVQMIVLTK